MVWHYHTITKERGFDWLITGEGSLCYQYLENLHYIARKIQGCHLMANFRQEQAGFRCGRSCSDLIFIPWQILEKVMAWQRPVIMNIIDFNKVFDSVHCPLLWHIVRKYGIPEDIVSIIQNLYEDSQKRSQEEWSYRRMVHSVDGYETRMHTVTPLWT